jgi:hypothetical protein
MEVSGQINAPAALPPGKEKKPFPAPARNQTLVIHSTA